LNEKNLNQCLLGISIIFILSGLLISFSSDAYIEQLILTPVFADQNWPQKIYDSTNPGNYMYISTESEDNDTEFNCSKILETCEPTGQTNTSDTEVDNKESDEISQKYFEQDRSTSTPVTPPTSTLNLSETQLTEKNVTGIPQDNLQIYENPTLGVKIQYPMEWNQVENQTNRYSVLTFSSPQENSQGTIQEKFLIRINNEPTDMSLDEYTNNVNESMQNNSNFQVTGSNSTVLANNPASSVTGILKEGGNDLQVLDQWTIKGGKVYRIVFYSDPGKADSFEPLVQKILESFSLTK
jgi:PsbP-like protein